MSFVWQEAFQPRQRISTQECLMSKSTQKKRGEVGGNPTPGLLSLWPSSNGLERAGRGSQQCCRAQRAEQRRRHALFIPLPTLCSCCGCPREPQDAARLLTVPCSPPSLPPVTAHVIAPNTAHGAGAAVPTPGSRRGPASAPSPRGSEPHTPLPLRPGLFG